MASSSSSSSIARNKNATAATAAAAGGKLVHLTPKHASMMNRTTSGVAGVLEDLKTRIDMLDKEIKADLQGKQEFDEQLFRLNRRKAEINQQVHEIRNWMQLFENKIKPLEGKYSETTSSMESQYDDAKLRHAQGIEVLIANFDYHPEFKRFSDTFSAVPFRPK